MVLIIPQKEKTELIPSLRNHIMNGMRFLLNDQSQLVQLQDKRCDFKCYFLFLFFCSEDKCAKCDVHAHCENGQCVCDGGYYGEGIRGECFRVGGMWPQQIT